MPGAMQEVRADEHNSPSGQTIYGVYQILQEVVSMQTKTIKNHIHSYSNNIWKMGNLKQCELVRGHFLFT